MDPRSLCTLSLALTLLPAIARADIAPTTGDTTAAATTSASTTTGGNTTSGTTGATTGGTTTAGATDASTGVTAPAGTDTEPGTMPPKFEPCGCSSDELGGGGSLLIAGLALWALRRRRAP